MTNSWAKFVNGCATDKNSQDKKRGGDCQAETNPKNCDTLRKNGTCSTTSRGWLKRCSPGAGGPAIPTRVKNEKRVIFRNKSKFFNLTFQPTEIKEISTC